MVYGLFIFCLWSHENVLWVSGGTRFSHNTMIGIQYITSSDVVYTLYTRTIDPWRSLSSLASVIPGEAKTVRIDRFGFVMKQEYNMRMRSSLVRMRSSLVRMRSSLVRMRSSLERMRSSLVRMRSSLERMRSSLVIRASDCQCTSCNGPGFDPSIRLHSVIWRAADVAVLNIVRKKI